MKVEYLNAFVQAACEVLEELTGLKLEKDKVHLNPYPIPSFELSMIIGITGFIRGQVVYSMSSHTAESIVRKWLKDLPEEKVMKMLKSGIAEIANVITGRSTSLLQRKKKILNVTPPSIITGDKFKIEFLKLRTIVVSMKSEIGDIEISLALADVDDDDNIDE